MSTKHTKEYAEKLALKHVGGSINKEVDRIEFIGFKYGYLKSIEENAVPELLEALEELLMYQHESENDLHEALKNKAEKAIKKAKS